MKLVSVYTAPFAVETLYQLLRARPPEECISHRKMPTYTEHERFVKSKPYYVWKLIEADEIYVGAIYMTDKYEIGAHCFPQHQDKGYEKDAITTILQRYNPHPTIANVNPANIKYAETLKDLGFRLIQHTYEKTT